MTKTSRIATIALMLIAANIFTVCSLRANADTPKKITSGVIYHVGTQIAPGDYYSPGLLRGFTTCEWWTERPNGGNYTPMPGESIAHIRPEDTTFRSVGCQNWITPLPPDVAEDLQEMRDAFNDAKITHS